MLYCTSTILVSEAQDFTEIRFFKTLHLIWNAECTLYKVVYICRNLPERKKSGNGEEERKIFLPIFTGKEKSWGSVKGWSLVYIVHSSYTVLPAVL
jgi:hypothetical protein